MSKWCAPCDRWFISLESLLRHKANGWMHHWDCDDCGEHCQDREDWEDHCRDVHVNRFCQLCGMKCDDYWALRQHDDNEHDYYHCDKQFRDKAQLHQHYRESHHWCKSCNRLFDSDSNLQAHLNSSIHKPKDKECYFCPRKFLSEANIIMHLEAGTCPAGPNRRQIDAIIDRINGAIINRQNGDKSNVALPVYQVTNSSYDGSEYRCYFCPKAFRYLNQLRQHVNSPKHTRRDQKYYACPLKSCRREFETLSGLIQHAERSGCSIGRVMDISWRDGFPKVIRESQPVACWTGHHIVDMGFLNLFEESEIDV